MYYSVSDDPYSVATGDLNRDGHPDLVTSNRLGDNISVLLGSWDGTFQDAVNYKLGYGMISVTIGDFNEDGHPDIAAASYDGPDIFILDGHGDGSFHFAHSYSHAGDGAASVPQVMSMKTATSIWLLQGMGHPNLPWQRGRYISSLRSHLSR